jgi:hypothetical protein
MALLRNHGKGRNGPEGVARSAESVPGTILFGELPDWGAGNTQADPSPGQILIAPESTAGALRKTQGCFAIPHAR